MSIYDGGREPVGDASATVEALVDAAKRTFGPIISRGTEGVVTPFVTSTSVDKPTWDQNFIRQSFLGRVVSTGPNNEADLSGSQYWIREVWDYSPSDEIVHRPDFELIDEYPVYNLPAGRYGKWVPATNVAEYMPDAQDAEAHSLSVAGDVHVHVFMTLNRKRQSTYYFTSGGGIGSTLGFALVKNIWANDSPFIQVQMLVPNPDTGELAPQVDPDNDNQPVYVNVWCWPPLTGDHYEALVWPGSTMTADSNPVGIRQVGSRFYAEQTLLTFPIRSPGVEHSDCPLVTEQ